MTKSERLLALLQLLRQYKKPVRAETLSKKLDVSKRTVYRDIEALRLQGAKIDGEAGVGYVLSDGYLLPPLMFSIEEVESLMLGSQWVTTHGDAALRDAATQAIAKIHNVIPQHHRSTIDRNTLFTPLMSQRIDTDKMAQHAKLIRQSIRDERIVNIGYKDAYGNVTQRTVHPFTLAFFDSVQVVGAWCNLRKEFRNFRVDRIDTLVQTSERYFPGRESLFREWRAYCESEEGCSLYPEFPADKN